MAPFGVRALTGVYRLVAFSSHARAVPNDIQALTEMWRDIMGVDISSKGWKDTPLSYLPGIKNDHLTGGLILNYELKAGSPHPQVKVYLPVRLYCPNDYKTACKSAKFYGIENQTAHEYAASIQSIFSPHRPLHTRSGIQTYVGLGIKGSSGCEVATYFNPEAYAPERSSQP